MKIFIYYPILFCFALFCQPLFAENLPKNFSINLKFSIPLLKSDVPQLRLCPDPGIEALYHFRLFKGVRFGTGIGFEYGHHIWNKENAGIIWMGGKPFKTSSLYVYNFDFITAVLPVYFEVPIQTRFINAINMGFSYGRYLKNDFYLQRATLLQEPELNKSYVSGQIGLQIPLLRVKNLPLNIHPFIENRLYLTDKNEYQKNYYSIGIKFSAKF